MKNVITLKQLIALICLSTTGITVSAQETLFHIDEQDRKALLQAKKELEKVHKRHDPKKSEAVKQLRKEVDAFTRNYANMSRNEIIAAGHRIQQLKTQVISERTLSLEAADDALNEFQKSYDHLLENAGLVEGGVNLGTEDSEALTEMLEFGAMAFEMAREAGLNEEEVSEVRETSSFLYELARKSRDGVLDGKALYEALKDNRERILSAKASVKLLASGLRVSANELVVTNTELDFGIVMDSLEGLPTSLDISFAFPVDTSVVFQKVRNAIRGGDSGTNRASHSASFDFQAAIKKSKSWSGEK